MLNGNDPRIKEYIDNLIKQKNFYNSMVSMSMDEQNCLAAKPLNLVKIVEILKTKDDFINRIHTIEHTNVTLRQYVDTNNVEPDTKETINNHLSGIGCLLEKLLDMDAGNEQTLQEKLRSKTVCSVNRHHAVKAYGTYAK